MPTELSIFLQIRFLSQIDILRHETSFLISSTFSYETALLFAGAYSPFFV